MANISSWTELNDWRNNENYQFDNIVLLKDLKISDEDYLGNVWVSLPQFGFGHTFNGGGHYIEGLTAPLFESLYDGNLYGLGLVNCNINTGYDIYTSGLLANICEYFNISNCYVTGSVVAKNVAGGLIGTCSEYSTISNCYVNVSVNNSGGFAQAGGLVGICTGSLTNCFSVGTVTYNTVMIEFGGGLAGSCSEQPVNCGWLTTTCTQAVGTVADVYPGTVTYNADTISEYYSKEYGVYSNWNFTLSWKENVSSLPTLNPIGLKPTAPVLTISDSKDDYIKIEWTESIATGGEILGYKIERKLFTDISYSVLVVNTENTDLEYIDDTVETGKEYNYRIYGLSYFGDGFVSNVVGFIAKTPSLMFLDSGIEIPEGNFIFYGDENTDGSLRVNNNSGIYTVYKRISGEWVSNGSLSGVNTGDQDLSGYALKTNVIELDNTTEFTPDADYEPATKKYVDDEISGVDLSGLVPYTGATSDINLGINNIYIQGIVAYDDTGSGASSYLNLRTNDDNDGDDVILSAGDLYSEDYYPGNLTLRAGYNDREVRWGNVNIIGGCVNIDLHEGSNKVYINTGGLEVGGNITGGNLSGTNTGDDIKASVQYNGLDAFTSTVSRRGRTNKAKSMTTYDVSADATGSASVTIKKASYANYPSNLTTIGNITLTSSQKTTGNLSVSLDAGDYIIFELTSCSGITELLVELY